MHSWWFVFNTSISWNNYNPYKPFTFSDTKIKSLYMWRINNSYVYWWLVRRLQQVLARKTIQLALTNMICCYISFCSCLTIIGRTFQDWYFRRIFFICCRYLLYCRSISFICCWWICQKPIYLLSIIIKSFPLDEDDFIL